MVVLSSRLVAPVFKDRVDLYGPGGGNGLQIQMW